eukprot:CAMPEP_0114240802 /NCGR_PEP_ID=MMETSP0058-20121206/9296_1 /TAXON_ID=36894 /ORGANISM="Pyramimonas parkeae, CCMP726" /LENGTH=546 /DNA_ID=CAMNT_0001353291 /DNA_START=36 /DNA_END=1676 /DNA_ORIENTATION=-
MMTLSIRTRSYSNVPALFGDGTWRLQRRHEVLHSRQPSSLKANNPGSGCKKLSATVRSTEADHLEEEVDAGSVSVGQVLIAQANFMRVLVDPSQLLPEERANREAQIRHARVRARLAGLPCSVPADLDMEAPVVLLCNVRALLKKIKQRVLVGDKVRLMGVDWVDQRGMIDEVLPRMSELENPAIANVSSILLVFAFDQPPIEPRNMSRFLISAEAADLPFNIALNKADLVDEETRQQVTQQLRSWGYEPHLFSVAAGTGLAKLGELLSDQVTVIAGPSGVGKSSLINRLHMQYDNISAEEAQGLLAAEPEDPSPQAWARFDVGTDILGDGGGGAGKRVDGSQALRLDMQSVASVSQRTGRGRHTTRHVSLLQLPTKGLLADTPGFNQPALEMLPLEMLPGCFPEIRKVLEVGEYALESDDDENQVVAPKSKKCMFANCTHRHEPNCLVSGTFDRYQHYLDLYDEIEQRESKELSKKKRSATRKEDDHIRVKSGQQGEQRVEAKLETKRHRRTSRRRATQRLVDFVEEDNEGFEDEDAFDDEGRAL